jgi:hypothetical protein
MYGVLGLIGTLGIQSHPFSSEGHVFVVCCVRYPQKIPPFFVPAINKPLASSSFRFHQSRDVTPPIDNDGHLLSGIGRIVHARASLVEIVEQSITKNQISNATEI